MFFIIKKIMSALGLFLLDCLFPRECFGCGREGAYLCPECSQRLRISYPCVCFGCKRRQNSQFIGRLCADCQPRYAFEGIIIAADYEDQLLKKMIHACKYRFVAELGAYLGTIASQALQKFLEASRGHLLAHAEFFKAVVVSIPLSRRRFKWRGFNQAELIARRVAQFADLELNTRLLERFHRRAQAGLSEQERLSNLQGSFSLRSESKAPRLVLLIDDVVTTGTTLQEAAKALRKAGSEEVWCLVVAKG